MTDRVDDVTVVGGGDSGCLAALALKRMNPEMNVAVVDDFDAPLPSVGKATFLEILSTLHQELGINERRFIDEVRPVWKLTVYFRDWCDRHSFHYPFDPGSKFPGESLPNAIDQYVYWYEDGYRDPEHRTIGEEIAAQGKSPWYFDPRNGEYDRYDNIAYHLDTKRFNEFLRTLCRERGISMTDDQIVDVETSGDSISRIRGKAGTYESDLYVDATGFNRLLKTELDSEFVNFPIPLDAAVTTTVDRALSDIIPATVVDSGECGWFWHIDTYENRDLGYVYSTDHISDEAAKTEFVDHWDDDIDPDDVVKYEFDSGYYYPAWETNCVAIGNSAAFMEPLQAPALTTNARAAVKLASSLSAHGRVADDAVRDTFNAWFREAWNSIFDFISIHYRYSTGDNAFWRELQSIELRDRTKRLIEEFDRTGVDRNVDPALKYPETSALEIFDPMSFYVMMRNLGAESVFYETSEFDVPEGVREEMSNIDESTTNHVEDYLTHQEMYNTVVDT